MRAQINFKPGEVQNGDPIQVLTFDLASEADYRLYESLAAPEQDLDVWLTKFPQVWAETGSMGLAKAPVFVELKLASDPRWIHQYPMSPYPKMASLGSC